MVVKKEKKRKKISSNSIIFGIIINYLKPSIFVEGIEKIDIKTLKDNGIKLIICDLDNTLVPHFTKFPTKRVINFVKKIKEMNIDFLIASNNSKKRVEFFSKKIEIDNYIANAKKPFTKNIKNYIKKKEYKKDEIVMIGDMLITDILVANILNVDSILVLPLVNNDPLISKFTKFLENKIFYKLSRDNIITTKNQNIKIGDLDDYEIL